MSYTLKLFGVTTSLYFRSLLLYDVAIDVHDDDDVVVVVVVVAAVLVVVSVMCNYLVSILLRTQILDNVIIIFTLL